MPSSSAGNLSNLSGSTAAVSDEPPEKNPEKYSVNVGKRGQGLHVIVEDFFKQNITRARDRNVRSVFLTGYVVLSKILMISLKTAPKN